MSVLGIANNQYNYYNKTQHTKNNAINSGATKAMNTAPSNYTLHIGSEESEDGKALGMIGFPDGSSTSVFKGENYTADHPVFKVKTWDAEGNMTESEVDASTVDPANASLREMMALNANRKLNGEETFTNELLLSAGRLHGDEAPSGYEDFFSNNDWISEMIDFQNMQYRLGNMEGYLNYKGASQILQDISDGISNKENGKSTLPNAVDQYAEMVKDKIENQVQRLQVDNNERAFDAYGPNAPEVVKRAWMEAAEETGSNGGGVSVSGKVTHISAMAAQRAAKFLNGEDDYADILGNSVESAIAAAKKALYNLQNPLQPISTKSIEVLNEIEKEKNFYISFIEKLT